MATHKQINQQQLFFRKFCIEQTKCLCGVLLLCGSRDMVHHRMYEICTFYTITKQRNTRSGCEGERESKRAKWKQGHGLICFAVSVWIVLYGGLVMVANGWIERESHRHRSTTHTVPGWPSMITQYIRVDGRCLLRLCVCAGVCFRMELGAMDALF